jgi:HEXXH motif-containing protein
MARPQVDGYDTSMVLHLAETERTPWRSEPFRRPPPGGPPSVAGGAVAVRNDAPLLPAPRWRPVDGVHPNLERAIAFVERWPEVGRQWPQVLHTVQCFIDTDPPHGRLYSASHSVSGRFGVIGLTVDCPLATAQALVHELAHTKLRAMGVDNENAVRIVANASDALFPSPVVVGQPRPMTAVLHAQYSFIHVTQLDLHMLEREADPATRADIRALLARNVPRMRAGLHTLQSNVQEGEDGAAFLRGFLDWCEAVLGEAEAVLAAADV